MTSESEMYDRGFFEYQHESATRSARAMWPFIKDTLGMRGGGTAAAAQIKSVVDVGCGKGAWLKESNVRDHLGIDGEYADPELSSHKFRAMDLSESFELDRTFDLALCLEVAEHIPVPSAEGFVESVCKLAPIILFSAAAPFQGGQGHVNERWPSYWIEMFARRGYRASGYLRFKIWKQTNIDYWYRQNLLMFGRADHLDANPNLNSFWQHPYAEFTFAAVHPLGFGQKMGVSWDQGVL